MIAEPPFDVGAVNATDAESGPVAVATPTVGAPGADAGVTETAEDANEFPVEFLAFNLIE